MEKMDEPQVLKNIELCSTYRKCWLILEWQGKVLALSHFTNNLEDSNVNQGNIPPIITNFHNQLASKATKYISSTSFSSTLRSWNTSIFHRIRGPTRSITLKGLSPFSLLCLVPHIFLWGLRIPFEVFILKCHLWSNFNQRLPPHLITNLMIGENQILIVWWEWKLFCIICANLLL